MLGEELMGAEGVTLQHFLIERNDKGDRMIPLAAGLGGRDIFKLLLVS